MPAGYDDFYARHKLWPMGQIFGQSDPNGYMSNCFNNSEWYDFVLTVCDMLGNNPNITCDGGFGVSHDEEAMIMVFRGTVGDQELNEENQDYNDTVTFPGGGTVAKFWYNGFLSLWNGGLNDMFFSAKAANPTYELWVTGMSMGGSLASEAAAYISQLGYLDPSLIKMISFGQTRIGHKDFADRYPTLVPFAYRVTHNHDIVPHIIPYSQGYRHHKNEIWYPNNMTDTDTYVECDEPESETCADSIKKGNWTWADHWYFGAYGTCQKTRSSVKLY